jgi:hypothetical protein
MLLFCTGAHPRYPVFESKTGLHRALALSRCGALESDTEELDTEEKDNRRSERRLSELAKKRKSAEANRQTAQKHCTGKFRIQEHEGIEIDIRKTNRGLKSEGK